MRKTLALIAFAVIAAALYGGYWFVGRAQVETHLTEALDQANEGPYDVSYTSLNTRGFPSRFDTTVVDFKFADPATGTTWSAPVFQLLALAYRPNEVIAVFPPEQTIGFAGQDYQVMTNDMRASGRVRPSTALEFQNATVTLDNPRIRSEDGAELAMAQAIAAMRLSPDTTQTYDVFAEMRSIVLPENTRRFLDPQGTLPQLIQNLRIDSDVTLSQPLQLNANEDTPPQIDAITLTELSLNWGDIALTAIGEAAPNQNGALDGSVTVTTRNWETVITLGVANGMIDADRRFLVTEIVRNLDETPHIDDTLTLTLRVTDGQMSIGNFPIGPMISR
ncbi:DUF2125 domain-containing protein [Pseudooctadecabacter jejudonensis]|uniref:DUF2125 domain-containing protein n=1 Tax=Pseudooctadecabacter jejudonensis TaxID=1391910 RepID=A0A1Y5SXB8_9RHOB|nr:DUF2125 domain-containing protein [Pseudooctadecabacter jejudonensis]SLN51010.1 hypothetical protein PSJ8397_02668 [Pseudooctadecabacter jejudonensis]